MLEDARFRGLQRSLHPCFAKNERCPRVETELTVDRRSDSIRVGKTMSATHFGSTVLVLVILGIFLMFQHEIYHENQGGIGWFCIRT